MDISIFCERDDRYGYINLVWGMTDMGMSILCGGRQIWICQSSVRGTTDMGMSIFCERDDRYGYVNLL